MSYTPITDLKKINSKIGSIQKRGRNLDRDIGHCAVDCIAHAQATGDISAFGRLCSAMPNGSRVERLIGWAQQYAPVACAKPDYKASIDKARVREGEFQPDRSDWQIEAMADSDWTEYKPAQKEQEFGLEQLKKLLKTVADGKRKGSTPEAETAASLLAEFLERDEQVQAILQNLPKNLK